MEDLTPLQIRQLKAFFLKLQSPGVNFNIAKVPQAFQMVGLFAKKADCLKILRSFPELKGEQFKNDQYLVNYIKNPANLEHLLNRLNPAERSEFREILQNGQPIPGAAGGQAGEQQAAGTAEQQGISPASPGGTPAGNMPFSGMPSVSGSYSNPHPFKATPAEHNIPHTEKPDIAVEPKIAIANSSGKVVEERTVKASGPSVKSPNTEPTPKIYIANKGGIVKEPPPAQIFVANKSGIITGERTPGVAAKTPAGKIYLANSSGTITKEHPVSPKRFNFPAFRSSANSFFKKVQNFASPAGPFLKINSGRVVNGLKGILGGAGGGLGGLGRATVGPGLTGVANLGGRIGSAGIGAFSGMANAGAGLGRFGRGGNGRNAGSLINKAKNRSGLMFALGIVIFGALVGGLVISSSSSPSGTTSTAATSPSPNPAGTILATDISQCKFTRSGDYAKELTYQSPLLLSYIQEASNLTAIPSAVLAAFIRVETPGTVVKADEQIMELSSKAACPRSSTGALGVMQLQPKGTKGHDDIAVTNGAKLIGKNYDDLTEEDYCDVRKNIIMGAGFILKKMTYKTTLYPQTYGDGTKWDTAWTNDKSTIEKLVSGYYGCIRYGSSDDNNNSCSDPGRIYSYADDVSTSIQNCQTQAASPNPGIAPVVKEGHACVTNAAFVPFPGYANIQTGNYSYVCGHCTPIYNAIDAGTNPSGGTKIIAVTDGKVEDITNPIGGTALWLNGNDNRNYYYAHLQKGSLVIGEAKAGQVIGSIAAASDASSKNNGIAHVHFSAGTPGNRQDFGDPANIAAGPLLDTWCGNNVCNGKPNAAYTCTGGW